MKRGAKKILIWLLLVAMLIQVGAAPAMSVSVNKNQDLLGGENLEQQKNKTAEKSRSKDFKPGELIIKVKSGIKFFGLSANDPSLRTLNKRLGVKGAVRLFAKGKNGLDRIYKLKLSKDADIQATVNQYRRNNAVEYAEPNYQVKADIIPNDPYYSSSGSWGQPFDDMWGLHKIEAAQAWDITIGTPDVLVAVVDTGVDRNHEDLSGNTWVNSDEQPGNGIDDDGNGYVDDYYGWDFCNNDNDPIDDHGHGTHVSGTIAARTNNSLGVAGLSWNGRVMAVKFLDQWGYGFTDAGAAAITYAADNGAKVINNSWGGPYSQLIDDAVTYAHNLGAVVTAAAGNGWGDDASSYTPAGAANALTATATDINDLKAGFSTVGSAVEVAVPGVDILSLRAAGTDMYGDGSHIVGGNYYYASGTSMSAPHVSGLAALLFSQDPSRTNVDVINRLVGTTQDIDGLNPGWEGRLGTGRIDAYAALSTETVPRLAIRYVDYQVDDSAGGDGNGRLSPGESADLSVLIRAISGTSTDVTATITSASPSITVLDSTGSYGSLATWTPQANVDPFRIQVTSDTTDMSAQIQLNVSANGGSYTWSGTFNISLVDVYEPDDSAAEAGQIGSDGELHSLRSRRRGITTG